MELQHEMIIPNEGMPFKLFLFEGGGGNYVREKHWHTSVEIFAVLEGELFFYLNEREHLLKAGERIIINSNVVHSIYAPKENKTVVLQIPLKQFEDYFTAQRFIRFSQIPNCDKIGDSSTPEGKLQELVRTLYETYAAQETGYDLRSRALYYEILYLLVRDYRQTEVEERQLRYNKRLDALSKITSYMRDHYTEDLKLAEVAGIFGYSAEYLSRMFKKYAKINFKTYLQDIRMAYAYRELMNTNRSISQIAMENGFCDSRSFAKEFRKRYGILPSEAKADSRETAKADSGRPAGSVKVNGKNQ